YGFAAAKANSEARNADAFGVLRLTLRPGGYDWAFVPVAGQSFDDRGTGACHGAPATARGALATALVRGAAAPTLRSIVADPFAAVAALVAVVATAVAAPRSRRGRAGRLLGAASVPALLEPAPRWTDGGARGHLRAARRNATRRRRWMGQG
ncbi:MAG: acid phosphatase type 7, partial [Thermomicrobiales bacterium]|nr:acid phosphatase type 7 [Thermomicrobiales bacterium]